MIIPLYFMTLSFIFSLRPHVRLNFVSCLLLYAYAWITFLIQLL